jgi:hypothetical protein
MARGERVLIATCADNATAEMVAGEHNRRDSLVEAARVMRDALTAIAGTSVTATTDTAKALALCMAVANITLNMDALKAALAEEAES